MYTPESILAHLISQSPSALCDLPSSHGIYGLVDHTRAIRYLGVTRSPRMGFKKRINSYHVTGSESQSHKFAHAYNTGRMWRHPKDTSPKARRARALRAHFCRENCGAVYLEIPRPVSIVDYFAYLRGIESKVQTIAPPHMRDWHGLNFQNLEEPVAAVERAIVSGGFLPDDIEIFKQQARAYVDRSSLKA